MFILEGGSLVTHRPCNSFNKHHTESVLHFGKLFLSTAPTASYENITARDIIGKNEEADSRITIAGLKMLM